MPTFEIDAAVGDIHVATGIDEVGRGCLAGPVVVAAVRWDFRAAAGKPWFPLLADSKTIDAARRAALLPHILAHAEYVRVASLSHMVIDYLNILRATLHGFELVAPAYHAEKPLFIDGNQRPASLPWAQTLIKGDSRMSAVAAASVVAKVTRDAMLVRLGRQIPQYGYEQHMGYATAQHRKALATHGPGLHHRKSFSPISEMVAEETPLDAEWLEKCTQKEICWPEFMADYPKLSLTGARRILGALQAQGYKLFPSARDQPK